MKPVCLLAANKCFDWLVDEERVRPEHVRLTAVSTYLQSAVVVFIPEVQREVLVGAVHPREH